MEKAGLKTFVYSFVFSLFALFGVHGAFLHTPESRNLEAKIPNKNITLFLKDTSLAASRAQSAPAKKIILSSLPEISPKRITDEQIPLSSDDIEEIKTAKQTLTTDIPLQGPVQPAQNSPSKTAANKETVIRNFAQIIKSPPPVGNAATENAPLSPEPLQPRQQLAQKAVYRPEAIMQEPEERALPAPHNLLPKPVETPQQEKAVFAQNDAPPPNTDTPRPKAKQELLIPLEKNSAAAKFAKNEVKTVGDIQENQVALNARNVPIKSMASAQSPGSDSRENKSEWQSMAEKQPKAADETPWVIAKGGKFPRNEMVLQDKAYIQDEEEIRRILSAENKNLTTDKSGGVKLAAETAKNLLIPIPDEIMKEKNITPQLISSSKNQALEEDPAARETLQEKNEEAEENINMHPPSANEKKSGLLNSLSSIFTGKKSAPQIGNSVEEGPESQNSLLSAFTRKKTRSASKILPTEIRLSFQPNRAEISGQTLKWIRAFAQKTAEEAATGLEIRIDGTSSPLLQRRRLNLLQNILMNEGADPNKIRTVFTTREPNSFILRTIRINSDNIDMPQKRIIAPRNNYMQW